MIVRAHPAVSNDITRATVPRVSVVIPTYNQCQYLAAAIRSVLAQTCRDYELIVVDDGSSDQTPEVVAAFSPPPNTREESGERAITYLRQSNQGCAAARNAGIRTARAPLIAPLDSDDEWQPGYLARMLSVFERYPEAGGAYCGYIYTDAAGCPVGSPRTKVVPQARFYQTLVCEGNWLSTCGVVFRKDVAQAAGLFDPTPALHPAEDADLWIRMAALRPFVGLPEALVTYRRHAANASNNALRAANASYLVAAKHFGPPVGDPAAWPGIKRCAYTRSYVFGASMHLAAGNVAESASCLTRLITIAPERAFSPGLWRSLAVAHLPVAERQGGRPPSQVVERVASPEPRLKVQVQLVRAERDLQGLLVALAGNASNGGGDESNLAPFARCEAAAALALARVALAAGAPCRAAYWLPPQIGCPPPALLTATWWGGAARLLAHALRGLP